MQPYAIISTGGKQYKVNSGDVISIERLSGSQVGDTIDLPVLAAHNGEDFQIGAPELDQKASVTVLAEERAKKIIVFKKHRRQTYRKKNGHRQNLISVRIDSIPGS